MKLKFPWYGSELIKSCVEFASLKLWERYDNCYYFAVETPDCESPAVVSIMGNGGIEFGLNVLRGPEAMDRMLEMRRPGPSHRNKTDKMDLVGFSMERFGRMHPDFRKWIKATKYRARPSEWLPELLVKPPGKHADYPGDRDVRLLLYIVRGILASCGEGTFAPMNTDPSKGVFTLVLSGEPPDPRVRAEVKRQESDRQDNVLPFVPAAARLRGLPILDATWIVGIIYLPTQIQDDDRTVSSVLVIDADSAFIVHCDLVMAGNTIEAAEVICDAFAGQLDSGLSGVKGIPKTLIFCDRELYDTLKPILSASGVTCRLVPNHPIFHEVAGGLVESMGGAVGIADTMLLDEKMEVPDDDDLDAWKEINQYLIDLFHHVWDTDDKLRRPRPSKRYFGTEDWEYFCEEYDRLQAFGAYLGWGILSYRATRKSRTEAEKLIAQGLSEPLEILLRARMATHPSLYRVNAINGDRGTVELEDVLLGGTVTADDKLFSQNSEIGWILPCRVTPVGDFHFLQPAGPILTGSTAVQAIDVLKDFKVQFTREGLLAEAHKIGWLWDWYDHVIVDGEPLTLQNTDGDTLEFHTASFRVADEQTARKALLGRDDIEYFDDDDRFDWIAVRPGPGSHDQQIWLGNICFVVDELVLEVDSKQRLETAREWLERIEGVAFEGVTVKDPLDTVNLPPDETINPPEPVELPDEVIAGVQDRINGQYMAWIDEPLPILKGKTPRQLARTADGKQHIAAMIRAIPDPVGKAPITVPREQMFRELGLH